jgi:hypothetical protein
MELQEKRLLQYQVEAMIKVFGEMVEQSRNDVATAGTITIENFYKTEVIKWQSKLELAKEFNTLLNK